MKFLAVLLGLVCLACSQVVDIETLKNQVITVFETELTKMGVDAKQAADIARSIVDDEDNWAYLMEEHSKFRSTFLSELNVKDMLEDFLPHDFKTELLNGNLTQSRENDDYDEYDAADDEN